MNQLCVWMMRLNSDWMCQYWASMVDRGGAGLLVLELSATNWSADDIQECLNKLIHPGRAEVRCFRKRVKQCDCGSKKSREQWYIFPPVAEVRFTSAKKVLDCFNKDRTHTPVVVVRLNCHIRKCYSKDNERCLSDSLKETLLETAAKHEKVLDCLYVYSLQSNKHKEQQLKYVIQKFIPNYIYHVITLLTKT